MKDRWEKIQNVSWVRKQLSSALTVLQIALVLHFRNALSAKKGFRPVVVRQAADHAAFGFVVRSAGRIVYYLLKGGEVFEIALPTCGGDSAHGPWAIVVVPLHNLNQCRPFQHA